MKIAVVGAGYWGRNLVRNFDNLGALHTICDTDAGLLAELLGKHPAARKAVSYTDVLADSAIDGVAIAAPAAAHASLVRESLRHEAKPHLIAFLEAWSEARP